MRGKTVVITGATSGIGAAAAHALAKQGARIVFIARDRQRGQTTLCKLRSIAPGLEHRVHYADLSRVDEMKRVALDIADQESSIDVLINNAGILLNSRQVTLEGLELTFAVNHLAYFVITQMLLHRLAPNARIINTASRAHARGTINFDDLQSARRFVGHEVYAMTKLCNVLFTRELARRLAGTNITVNCLSPGFVATRWGSNSGGLLQHALAVAKFFARTPEQGAQTMLYLATSPEVANLSGAYLHDRKQIEPSAEAKNDEIAQRLWTVSMKLAGIEGAGEQGSQQASKPEA